LGRRIRVGVDTGGTFTDVVGVDADTGEVASTKTPSTPADPGAGFLTGGREWAHVGRFLGPSIEQHYRSYPVARHVEMWQDAGLEDVRVRTMSLGGGLVMRGRRAGGPSSGSSSG